MDQPDETYGITSDNIGQILRKVVDDWRLEQRKSIRHRLVDFEDRLEKLEGSDWVDAEKHRSGIEEARDRYVSGLDAKYAMIDETHRQMVAHLDRCERNAE